MQTSCPRRLRAATRSWLALWFVALALIGVPQTPPAAVAAGIDPAPLVTYAGGAAHERFTDLLPLSDGTLLVAGQADSLDWLDPAVPRVELPTAGITNTLSLAPRVGFLLHISPDLSSVLHALAFPPGAVEGISRIRTTSAPGAPTGAIFISGAITGPLSTKADKGGYFIARLDGNFVDQLPTGLAWARSIWATGDHRLTQPWDVGGDGKVVFVAGQSFAFDWADIQRFDADGNPEVVEHWPAHWSAAGEWDGSPASAYPNQATTPLLRSAIVLKTRRSGGLRSTSDADYGLVAGDGNGGTRQGRFPDDQYYGGPCMPAPGTCALGIGATGYYSPTKNALTPRVGAIAIDRRTSAMYVGYSAQARSVGGTDVEPAVVAFDADGQLRWWSRLHAETPAGSPAHQLVDGLEVDYSRPPQVGALLVLARTLGAAGNDLWAGDEIAADAAARGFQNRLTGADRSVEVAWLGKLRLLDGTLLHSTYVGEYAEGGEPFGLGGQSFGAPLDDPRYDLWPDPSDGDPRLGTTRCDPDVRLDTSGQVYVLCSGTRTLTTAGAYQPMVRPGEGWATRNMFVRVYTPDLRALRYSSLLTGAWDSGSPATLANGGDNTILTGVAPLHNGLLVAGYHLADAAAPGGAKGNPVPTAAVPAWGASAPSGESALLARLGGVRYPVARLVALADDLSARVAQPLPELAVQVLDAEGNPTPGVSVSFAAPPAGPTLSWSSGNTAVSDPGGIARITATAGTVAGSYQVEATAAGADPALVELQNLPGAPAEIVAVSGDAQAATVQHEYRAELVVEVRDAYANPVPGAAVTFSVAGPDGAASFPVGQHATSGPDGRAALRVAAGSVPGEHQLLADTEPPLVEPAVFRLVVEPARLFLPAVWRHG